MFESTADQLFVTWLQLMNANKGAQLPPALAPHLTLLSVANKGVRKEGARIVAFTSITFHDQAYSLPAVKSPSNQFIRIGELGSKQAWLFINPFVNTHPSAQFIYSGHQTFSLGNIPPPKQILQQTDGLWTFEFK